MKGLVFPLGVAWGVVWNVGDVWRGDQSLELEFGEHGNCCMG